MRCHPAPRRDRLLRACGVLSVVLFACHSQMTLSDPSTVSVAGRDGGGTIGGGGGGATGAGAAAGTVGGGGTGGNGGSGDTCSGGAPGACSAALQCLSCPSGATTAQYLCSTPCTASDDCTDPARPLCNQAAAGSTGLCTASSFVCRWQVKCASPLTRIATPRGLVPIASLAAGDVVYSIDRGKVAAVPILETTRRPAPGHHVVRAVLASGAVLEISEAHPTADGRTFRDLAAGDLLGRQIVTAVQSVPYRFAETFDILPASDTGTYFAEGALIGSTLAVGPATVDLRVAMTARVP
jgi:hypothetical protein